MRYIITGANGTVGKALEQQLLSQGHEIVHWDRQKVPIDDYDAMEAFIRDTAPNGVFHLATASQPTGRNNESWLVNYEWTSEIAWITRKFNIPFLFTSTALVFSDNTSGPFTLTSQPDAPEGYGCEKRLAEERVFYQNPNAVIVRLGWQIDSKTGGNNMVEFLDNQMRQHSSINASTAWLPACSMLADTVVCLEKLIHTTPGLYMLDGNEKWSFYDIASAINEQMNMNWAIQATTDYVFDQRMMDARVDVPKIDTRLPIRKGT